MASVSLLRMTVTWAPWNLPQQAASEDKVNVPVPDEEPKKCRTVGALVVDDGDIL